MRREGTCNACGQIITFEVDESKSAEDLNIIATNQCTCSEGKRYRAKYEIMKEAKSKIERLFGTPECYTARGLMLNAAELIADREIKNITIALSETTKAKICINAKDELVVARTENTTRKL